MNNIIKSYIRDHCTTANWPCDGVNFIDIFPLLEETYESDFKKISSLSKQVPLVFMPEARGFLFYGALGPDRTVPLRKKGKLPGEVTGITYQKEYGQDVLYYQPAAIERVLDRTFANWLGDDTIDSIDFIPVLVFDDLLATGGTVCALIDHINTLSYHGKPLKVIAAAFYIELATELPQGRTNIESRDVKVVSLYEY